MKLLGLLIFLLPVTLLGQKLPVDPVTGKIYIAEEVLVMDGPQSDLYNRAKAWFATCNKNVKTLQIDEVANGLLIGKNQVLISVIDDDKTKSYNITYTLKIEMEDDRYWYSLSDFTYQPDPLPKNNFFEERKSMEIPLEALLFSKKKGGDKNRTLINAVEKAVYESILALVIDLKANML